MIISKWGKEKLLKEKYTEMIIQIVMKNNNYLKLLHNLKKMAFLIQCNKLNNPKKS